MHISGSGIINLKIQISESLLLLNVIIHIICAFSQVVVLLNSSLNDQIRFGEFCHANKIKFITAATYGLFG